MTQTESAEHDQLPTDITKDYKQQMCPLRRRVENTDHIVKLCHGAKTTDGPSANSVDPMRFLLVKESADVGADFAAKLEMKNISRNVS